MEATQQAGMVDAQYRALLTDREREILAGEADVTDNYRYRVVSRVRTKLDALETDVALLREHHPGLLAEVQEVTSDETGGEVHAARVTVDEEGEAFVGEEFAEAVEEMDEPVFVSEEMVEALDALNLDADRREAVRAMYEYLRDARTARKSDFTGEVYPEHPAGLDSPDGWWNALATGSTTAESKGALADLPGVEKPPSGRPQWRFTGEE